MAENKYVNKIRILKEGYLMNLIIYDSENEYKAICAYSNCYAIPQKNNTIAIGNDLYEVITHPCFCYEKNTVWVFAKKC